MFDFLLPDKKRFIEVTPYLGKAFFSGEIDKSMLLKNLNSSKGELEKQGFTLKEIKSIEEEISLFPYNYWGEWITLRGKTIKELSSSSYYTHIISGLDSRGDARVFGWNGPLLEIGLSLISGEIRKKDEFGLRFTNQNGNYIGGGPYGRIIGNLYNNIFYIKLIFMERDRHGRGWPTVYLLIIHTSKIDSIVPILRIDPSIILDVFKELDLTREAYPRYETAKELKLDEEFIMNFWIKGRYVFIFYLDEDRQAVFSHLNPSKEKLIEELTTAQHYAHAIYGVFTNPRRGFLGLGAPKDPPHFEFREPKGSKYLYKKVTLTGNGVHRSYEYVGRCGQDIFKARTCIYGTEKGDAFYVLMIWNDPTHDSRQGVFTAYILLAPDFEHSRITPIIKEDPSLILEVFKRVYSKHDYSKGKLQFDWAWYEGVKRII